MVVKTDRLYNDSLVKTPNNITHNSSTRVHSGSSTKVGEGVVYRTLLPVNTILTELIRYLEWNKLILIYEDATCK